MPAAIQEAVQAHFHGEGAEALPPPTALEVLTADADCEGGAWMLVDVDLSRIEARTVRLKISLPADLVKRIDDWTGEQHMTRSGFLARAAEQAMKSKARSA